MPITVNVVRLARPSSRQATVPSRLYPTVSAMLPRGSTICPSIPLNAYAYVVGVADRGDTTLVRLLPV